MNGFEVRTRRVFDWPLFRSWAMAIWFFPPVAFGTVLAGLGWDGMFDYSRFCVQSWGALAGTVKFAG